LSSPRFTLFIFLLLAALPMAAPAAESTAQPGKLYWSNGDILEGTLIGSDQGRLRWSSKEFTDALEIKTEYLQSVRFDSPKSVPSGGPFRIALMNGDILYGEPAAIDDSYLSLRSPRHGLLRLNRGEIVNLRRMNHPSLVFLGPNGQEGWSVLNPNRAELSHWTIQPGGGLRSERWRAELFRPVIFPDKTEIEVVLRCSQRPEFAIAFDSRVEKAIRIETWDDEMVMTNGALFEQVSTLNAQSRLVHLRVFLDQTAGTVAVFSGDGRPLANMKMPVEKNPENKKSGFYLCNKGPDMELARLRIGQWNGLAPERVQEEKSRIRLVDGGYRYGQVTQLSEDGQVKLEDGQTIALDQIETVDFRPEPAKAPARSSAELVFPDGSLISGSLISINNGQAQFSTNYSPAPVTTKMDGARELQFNWVEVAANQATDELHQNNRILHGTLTGGESGSPLQWLQSGSSGSVSIPLNKNAQVIRTKSRGMSNLDGDRLFLNSGEIISCQVDSIGEEFVKFSSSFTAVNQLPVKQVRAVEFRHGRLQLTGFADHAWAKLSNVKGEATREANRLILNGGAIQHPSILRADEIAFDVKWKDNQQGAVSLGLFTADSEDSAPPLEIGLSCWINRLWVSATESGMGNQTGGSDINIANGRASVRIRLENQTVRVWVNEVQLVNLEFELKKRLGNGLRFRTGGPWTDRMNDLGQAEITNFEVRSTTGLIAPLQVDQESKSRALTIPRFRREMPDTHIIITPGGDLLRGRLISVTKEGVRFTSRMEDLEFPRERVAGLVCLDAVETSPATELQPNETRVFLSDGTAIRLIPTRMTEKTLSGKSVSLGPCELPAASVRQIHIGKLEPITGHLVYEDWKRVPATEPVIPSPGQEGKQDSEWVGTAAKEFELPLLDGTKFKLAQERGKVVVLDFWATWCGPCAQALPEYMGALKDFPKDKVRFVTVNQAEPAAIIKPYLERHQWNSLEVALDSKQEVAAQYGVEGIPHTVVVDAEGKIAWVETGFRPGAGEHLKKAIEGLLNPAAKPVPIPAEAN